MLLAAAKSSSSSYLLIIYVLVFGGIYFFFIRPRSKRQKAQRQEVRKVEVGDRAQTIGGLVGTVVRDEDGLYTLKTDSGAELQFIHAAIAKKYIPPVEVDPPTSHDEPSEGDEK
jgi:preprotein translocase subunit YajC